MFNCMCVDQTQGTAPVHAEFLQFSSLDFLACFIPARPQGYKRGLLEKFSWDFWR